MKSAIVSSTIASPTTPAAGTPVMSPRAFGAGPSRRSPRSPGHQVGRGEGPGERGDRLDGPAHDDRLAVGDPAGQSARVVGAVDPATVVIATLDDVVDGRAEPPG